MDSNQHKLLEELFRAAYRDLLSLAWSQIRDYHRAEELVQDVFLLAGEKIADVERSGNPRGWLFRALFNLIKHEYRTQTLIRKLFISQIEVPEHELSNSPDFGYSELSGMFTHEEWRLLKLAYIDEYPVTQIAEEMNLKYDACLKRIHKVRDKAIALLTE